jgi:hypothetical protein
LNAWFSISPDFDNLFDCRQLESRLAFQFEWRERVHDQVFFMMGMTVCAGCFFYEGMVCGNVKRLCPLFRKVARDPSESIFR